MTISNNPQAGVAPPRREVRARQGLTLVGAVGTAFLASLCCIGPLLFVTLGIGAGLASRFEPLRPVFTVLTLALLALGFYTVYGRAGRGLRTSPGVGCAPDGSCPTSRDRIRDKRVLWIATVIAVIVLTFPQWSLLLA